MMRYLNLLKRNIKFGSKLLNVRGFCDDRINFKRILILNKRTRYELEKALRPGITEDHLEKVIRSKGSDFDKLIKHHNTHKDIVDIIVKQFSDLNVELQIVNRTNYGQQEVDWADLIVVGGGDGTFLLGASQIHNQNKPIVGFNTDPERSEGYLCLPKKYTLNIPAAINRIMKSDFRWLLRNRIEVHVKGTQAMEEVVIIDATKVKSIPDCAGNKVTDSKIEERVLPSLALNEVFMGETISSQVSHLLIQPDEMVPTSVKCSGLCVSTGTGSSSWHLSINRLTEDKVKKLFQASGHSLDDRQIKLVMDRYNTSLRFAPDEQILYWSMREPIYGSVFPDPSNCPAGGFTEEIRVTSRCFSGFLVIDGTHCYPFHDGTFAHLYSSPSKRLRTIHLD